MSRATSQVISASRRAAVVAAFAVSAAVATALPAGAAQPAHAIIGGERAPSSPAVVQITSGVGRCTATQLNENWILTAAHCVPADTTAVPPVMYQSNSVTNPGPAFPIAEFIKAPIGDTALARLAAPVPNTAYMPLNVTAEAASTGTGTIQGYGNRAGFAFPDALDQATVALAGPDGDLINAPGQRVQGITGITFIGDSGGPLIVDGKQVAIASAAESIEPTRIDTFAVYSLLSQNADWITATAGPAGIPIAPPAPSSPAGSSPLGSS